MSIWDVQITGEEQSPNDYPIAKPGTYEFEVTNATMKEYIPKQGSKIPNCAELDVTLKFKGIAENGKDVTVFDRLFFAESTIWKATAFTKCIGIFYKGMTPKNIANGCMGEVGTAEIDIHEYNGTKSNRVKKYICKDTSTPNKPIDMGSDSDELPF